QSEHLGAKYRAVVGTLTRRSLLEHHAALPHSRTDRLCSVIVICRRGGGLYARVSGAEFLRMAGGIRSDLVFRCADHASGDSLARVTACRDDSTLASPLCPLRFLRASTQSLGRD